MTVFALSSAARASRARRTGSIDISSDCGLCIKSSLGEGARWMWYLVAMGKEVLEFCRVLCRGMWSVGVEEGPCVLGLVIHMEGAGLC